MPRDSAFAYEMGRVTALEGRALGIHMAFVASGAIAFATAMGAFGTAFTLATNIDVLPMLIYTEFTLAANFSTSAGTDTQRCASPPTKCEPNSSASRARSKAAERPTVGLYVTASP